MTQPIFTLHPGLTFEDRFIYGSARELTRDDFIITPSGEPKFDEFIRAEMVATATLTFKEETIAHLLPAFKRDRHNSSNGANLYAAIFTPFDGWANHEKHEGPFRTHVRIFERDFLKRVRTRKKERIEKARQEVAERVAKEGEQVIDNEIARINQRIQLWIERESKEYVENTVRCCTGSLDVYEPLDEEAGTVDLAEQVERLRDQLRAAEKELREKRIAAVSRFWEKDRDHPQEVKAKILEMISDGKAFRSGFRIM